MLISHDCKKVFHALFAVLKYRYNKILFKISVFHNKLSVLSPLLPSVIALSARIIFLTLRAFFLTATWDSASCYSVLLYPIDLKSSG